MHMRTTLDLDEKLVAKAMKITGVVTKTSLIHLALEEIIRKANVKALLDFGGKIKIDFDVNSSRGRS
jgi:Arc/MetJ family transcription regulator